MTKNNNNPWKGLDSYDYSDIAIFFGRKNETRTLVDTIKRNRFTVLYGPSGVGKSSLINAGVRPELAKDNYFVVDISIRQFDLMSEQSISAQILARIKQCAEDEHIDITPVSKSNGEIIFEDSLWYFFHTNEFWSPKNELLTLIVIVDQFEDIFKDEVKEQSPEHFFNSLDELSNVVPPMSIREDLQKLESFRYNQYSDFRFVFSLREDFLPRLDDYVYSLNIPELRKSRYGVTLMDKEQAREVILGPANGIVSDNVANRIIDILSSQNSRNHLANRIEPFLLSLYMYRIYMEMTKRDLSSISEELISKIGADVVNDFYVESMKKISSKAMKHLETVLLTQKGHRDSISYDKLMESKKVTDDELKTLLEARIIKKNTINNVARFEFTHDILSKYAQKNKEKREQSNNSRLVGILSLFLSLLLSSIIGWTMLAALTYISIPVLIVVSIISSYGILNIKLPFGRRTLLFLASFSLLGICIDLIQIIPTIGYVLYFIICVLSFYLLKTFTDLAVGKVFRWSRYVFVGFVWVLSFLVIPVLCFGYNIYEGMNYSREEPFSQKMFYIKDGNGKYGIRERFSIVYIPKYDSTLYAINSDYIAKMNEKYGLLDSIFHIKKPMIYDTVIIRNFEPIFYLDGKEVSDNGLLVSWNKHVSEKQKEVLRKIVGNMIYIEGGVFEMGTDTCMIKKKISGFKPFDGEEDIHRVTLSNYFLNKYEVTIEEWKEIMDYNPIRQESYSIDNSKLPVHLVKYEECQKFIDKISLLSGLPFSLPTEAQWEYAAKGGQVRDSCIFAGSDNEVEVGWVSLNSGNVLHLVGEKKPNRLGLYDMTGNVSEFCKDYYSKSFYKESEGQKDPCCLNGNNINLRKIIQRGGSFDCTYPESYIVSRRKIASPGVKYPNSGFRLAINPKKQHLVISE